MYTHVKVSSGISRLCRSFIFPRDNVAASTATATDS